MSWQNEQKLSTWGSNGPATVGRDPDGDIGIMDDEGYSIILSPAGAIALREWLIAEPSLNKAGKG